MIEAILLGLLQGISEFLPISSSGHLALAGILFHVEDAGLTLNVLLHVGTLAATAFVLRERLSAAFLSGVRALAKPELFRTTPGGQDALFVVLASIPTAIIGLSIRDQVEAWTSSPLIVGLGFLFTSMLLVSTHFARPGLITHPVWQAALLLGLAQGIAVLPGISRSGSTIALALFLGVKRERAFELSMLMSIPAVFGAALIELPEDDWEYYSSHTCDCWRSCRLCLWEFLRCLFCDAWSWAESSHSLPSGCSRSLIATLAMARSWPV